MRTRCNNPASSSFEHYGGRGVQVLYADFAAFVRDVGLPPSLSHSIDRIDPRGHYICGNCRWATTKIQGRNRRRVHKIEWHGQLVPLAEWAEISGVPYGFAYNWLGTAKTAEEVLRRRVLCLNKRIRLARKVA